MQATEQKAQQTPQTALALSHASAGLSVFVLALVFALSGLWVGVAAALAGGGLWVLGPLRSLRSLSRLGALASSAALVVLAAAAGAAVWLSVGGAWPVLGVAAALVAWDLDQFAQLVRSAGRVDGAAELERRHIRRLLVVSVIGCALGAVGMGLRVRLTFEVALILAALAMLGLTIAVGFLRRLRD